MAGPARRDEAAARWVASISRGGPFGGPRLEVGERRAGAEAEAGEPSASAAARCAAPRRASTRRDSPAAPCLCPAPFVPLRRRGRSVPPVGGERGWKKGVREGDRKVGYPRQPWQKGHWQWRARASCLEELQLLRRQMRQMCQMCQELGGPPSRGARRSHLGAHQGGKAAWVGSVRWCSVSCVTPGC